jgi:hypothetical protein
VLFGSLGRRPFVGAGRGRYPYDGDRPDLESRARLAYWHVSDTFLILERVSVGGKVASTLDGDQAGLR